MPSIARPAEALDTSLGAKEFVNEAVHSYGGSVDNCAADIVYTNLFTGIHGNYLRPSIIAAGLDPDKLPESDPSAMNFGSGGESDAKAWKDIWGCGQGIQTKLAERTVQHTHRNQ